jgi:hypothetical protein
MMDQAERAELERTIGHAIRAHPGSAFDAALVELGWRDALTVDRRAAVSILFELLGFELASSTALAYLLARGLGLELPSATGFVLPPLGRSCPPGNLKDGSLAISGLGVEAFAAHRSALVIAQAGDTEVTALVPVADLSLRAVRGIDPEFGLVEVTGTVRNVGQAEVAQQPWSVALATARLAVGHELVGAARKMLELARQHALERVQFGHPIGAFQAVRHRLADTLVAIESADAVLDAAWEAISPTAAGVAKALAGRAGRTASRHCQQVLAGIGFTTEHEFHRYARRVFVLEHLLGDSRTLTREFGSELLATGRLPEFAPL